jgi:hypothetical protein
VHRADRDPAVGPNKVEWRMERSYKYPPPPDLARFADLRLTLPGVRIWEVKHACPLAFPAGDPTISLPVEFSGRGETVEVASLKAGGPVVVNVLRRPWLTACADGRRASTSSDEWGRAVVELPPGARRLEVDYTPPWRLGFLASALLGALALASWRTFAALNRKHRL